MSEIRGRNMTNFFKRELFMYALGDIKFKTPISLKRVVYTLAFILVWSVPIFIIFGFYFNPWYIMLLVIPPFAAGYYSTKPVFEGKNLISFFQSLINFLKEPKGWTDLKRNNTRGTEKYFTEHEIWISRRREIKMLKNLGEK